MHERVKPCAGGQLGQCESKDREKEREQGANLLSQEAAANLIWD